MARLLTKEAIVSLIVGLGLAIGVHLLPKVSYFLMPIITLVHETGHCAIGWIFGFPGIPTFDFNYGGGLTRIFERNSLFCIVIYLLFAIWLFDSRKKPRALIAIAVILIVYSLVSFSNSSQVLILFMGHGTELLFATICFYRALTGNSIVHSLERPLYACIGFFINIQDVRFSWGLLTDSDMRALYDEGKGEGVVMNDFWRIAVEYWHVDTAVVVKFFLVLCAFPLICSFLFHCYEPMIMRLLWKIFGDTKKEISLSRSVVALPGIDVHTTTPSVPEDMMYLWIDNQQQGPFTRSSLRNMVQLGTISMETPCWKEGMSEWKSLAETIPSLRLGLK
jgi:hypothetical protein